MPTKTGKPQHRARRYKGESLLAKLANYTVIDLETTSKYINDAEIVELAAVRVRDNEIVDTYSALIRPSIPIPLDVAQITHITDDMVADKPAISDVIDEYLDFLGEDVLLGHNIATYDVNLLCDTLDKIGDRLLHNDYIDTLRYARYCDIAVDNLRLGTLAEFFNIQNEHAHRALDDCITNHYVYQQLKPLYSREARAVVKHSAGGRAVVKLSAEIRAVQELQGAIQQMLDEDDLTTDNIVTVRDWLDDHSSFIDRYPFAEISEAIRPALSDGVIDEAEAAHLKDLFTALLDPLSVQLYPDGPITLDGVSVCVTGDFARGSRTKIKAMLESRGAKVVASVSSKTKYVIVGSGGSPMWGCGSYGNKVKRAFDLQRQGKDVNVYAEDIFFDALGE